MKLIIIFLSLFIFSCEKDENNNESQPDCRCATILQSDKFTISGQTISILIIENDCSGVQRQIEKNGVFEVGQKICD